MRDSFCAQVERTVVERKLFEPHSRVIVGLSGGADSVALLHALGSLRSSWKLTLHIAHLDHGIRDNSKEDADFVRGIGERLRIPCTIERLDVKALCLRDGYSLEDGARRIRYQFFLDVARRQSAGYVALAH